MSETGTLVIEDFGLLYKKFLILIFVVLLTRLKNIQTLTSIKCFFRRYICIIILKETA